MPLVLPLVHYRLVVRVNRPWRLPEYAGSMLRGIYGHALKEVACQVPPWPPKTTAYGSPAFSRSTRACVEGVDSAAPPLCRGSGLVDTRSCSKIVTLYVSLRFFVVNV